jgi:regulator of sigma E protease
MTVIIFLIVLAVLIFVHELGHFLVAKACGIRVDAFALGFGPKLIKKTIGEVTYSINLIPFGGYVKIFGENPDDESIKGPDIARSFVHKAKWKQVAVLFAGIFCNFLFAWGLISIAFMSGTITQVDSYPEYRDRLTDQRIAILGVNQNSPAERAGLKPGDAIVASSVEEIINKVNDSKSNGVEIDYIRNGVKNKVTVIAEEGIVKGKYATGIELGNVATLQLPFFKSIVEGFRMTLHLIVATVVGLYTLITGGASLSDVTGPVGIAGMVGDAAQLGFSYLIMFTALISINLGVLNLIPFPALDGGRILFVLIEAVIRRRIKPVIANTVNLVGFGLLLLLMVVVTYKDIVKLFVK